MKSLNEIELFGAVSGFLVGSVNQCRVTVI
jgi:hypothetical protein